MLILAALNPIWIAGGLAAVVAFFVVRELFRKDEKIEDRRRHAIEIARELSVQGLEHIPGLLTDYAVGDYSGMVARVKAWYEFLKDDEQRRGFFNKFLRKQLEIAMTDDIKRGYVLKTVEEWQAIEAAKKARLKDEIVKEEAAKVAAAGG